MPSRTCDETVIVSPFQPWFRRRRVGYRVGNFVGRLVGNFVGRLVGLGVGNLVGLRVGFSVGLRDGAAVRTVGDLLGLLEVGGSEPDPFVYCIAGSDERGEKQFNQVLASLQMPLAGVPSHLFVWIFSVLAVLQ